MSDVQDEKLKRYLDGDPSMRSSSEQAPRDSLSSMATFQERGERGSAMRMPSFAEIQSDGIDGE